MRRNEEEAPFAVALQNSYPSAKEMNPDTAPLLREAYYKEYDTLRQESLQSMGNRTQIISFGLGTIGVLVAGTIAASNPVPQLASLMFRFAIPAVSVLVYYAWFAEFERMVRAGRVLQRIEAAINETLPKPALTWESSLESMRMWYPYVGVAILFLGIASLSPMAARSFQGAIQPADFWKAVFLESWFSAALVFFAVVHTGRRYWKKFPHAKGRLG